MEYIYDSNCIYKLINVTEKIYNRYKEILDVNYGDDTYYYLIGELTRLSKLEDSILLSFPKTGRLLDDINNTIKKLYRCNDSFMYGFVLNRIDSNICNLCALDEEDNISKFINANLIDSQTNVNSIYDNIYYNYILRLNNVIDAFDNYNDKRKIRFIQLAYIFSFKNISDAFIENNLCLESDLINNCSDNFKDMDSYNSFMYLKNSITFNLCESLLMRNISLSGFYNYRSNDLFYLSNILLFKSVLQDINDPDFMEIRNNFMLDLESSKSDNFIIGKLKRCFDLEYERRFSLEKNETTEPLDVELSNDLITLMKLESSLYDKIMYLKLDGHDSFNVIKSLISYEKEIIDKMDINANNAPVISSIIDRDLDFFIGDNADLFRKNAIVQRIKNSFNYFKKSNIASGVFEKNYDSIMSNHIVDSLKKFNGDLSIIKSYLYMYPILTDDLVFLNGNYHMIDRFSDEVSSLSAGNNSVHDYYYDKNEQLYKLSVSIIDDIDQFSDIYESEWNSLLDFKICELSDIIDNVSDEYFSHLEEEVSYLEDSFVKKKILSLIKRKVY